MRLNLHKKMDELQFFVNAVKDEQDRFGERLK
jgi:hypothetical protein